MEPHTFLPTILEFGLSGWPPPGPNQFEWQGNQLRYLLPNEPAANPSSVRFAQPRQDEWVRFWAECDRLEIWNLPADFSKPIRDGLKVRMSVSHAGRSIRVSGQCADELPELVERIHGFHAALQQLVGYVPAQHR
jgi:hypothetical protein